MNLDFIDISIRAQISLGIALIVLLLIFLVFKVEKKPNKK